MPKGESAVPFLLIAPNSRASGMGESGTGSVDDASAIYWNPAELAFLKGQEISITHANWLPQFNLPDLFYDHLNYRKDIDAIGGTIGASVTLPQPRGVFCDDVPRAGRLSTNSSLLNMP